MSPINALIKDQVTKLRESGLRVCVLKDDRVDAVEVSVILSNPWKVYGGTSWYLLIQKCLWTIK